jgi:hypothetical protein
MHRSPKVLIVRTADKNEYKQLLDATEQHHRRYARMHGYSYMRYDGVVRGMKPWHAAFNRILLESVLSKKHFDWVLYMDADAVIVDLSKRLDTFLSHQHAIVACRGVSNDSSITWDINNGIALYKLRHPAMSDIVFLWRQTFESIPMDALSAEKQGAFDRCGTHIDDQGLLQNIIHQYFRGVVQL